MYPESYEPNILYPRQEDFEVVRKDDQTGFGVISHKGFKKGDIVAAINGELINEIRQHSLQIEPGVHLYDIHFSGYFLHSCSPNVFLDMKNRLVIATRKIKPGEYLLMDYAQTEDHLYKQFVCSCGSRNCRGWITGKKDPINENDPAYEQFISAQVMAV
jgi:hypothetical protein